MNSLVRAFYSCIKRPMKSILIFLIFFILGNFIVLGFSIKSASEGAIRYTREKMNPIVIVSLKHEIIDDEIVYGEIQSEILSQMKQDERVKVYNQTVESFAYGNDFSNVALENPVDKQGNSKWSPYFDNRIKIVSNDYPDMIEFYDKYKIVDGNFYTQEDLDNANNKVVINKTLAEINNLSVGDIINIDMVNENSTEINYYTDDNFKSFDLEIIGISDVAFDMELDELEKLDIYNTLFIPSTFFKEYYIEYMNAVSNQLSDKEGTNNVEFNTEDIWNIDNYCVFLLNDPFDLESFVSDYQSLLKDNYTLDANNSIFESYGKPLNVITFFSDFVILMVSINALLITIIIMALTTKMREKEVAIYLSMGFKKTSIISQFIIEIIGIAFLAISLALVTGSVLANKVGYEILDLSIVKEAKEDQIQVDTKFGSEYFTEVSQADVLSEYVIKIDSTIIIILYCLSAFIIFVSILFPLVFIMKEEPKKIFYRIE